MVFIGGGIALRFALRTVEGQRWSDRVKMRLPLVSEIWIKYQVAQLSRLMSTLLTGGIPLVQGLSTAMTATTATTATTARIRAARGA